MIAWQFEPRRARSAPTSNRRTGGIAIALPARNEGRLAAFDGKASVERAFSILLCVPFEIDSHLIARLIYTWDDACIAHRIVNGEVVDAKET